MTEPASGTNTQPEQREDTRQCRICLGGVEEEPELGRLIRPCRCKGSIRYVHVKCIERWRKTGTNSNSFWACSQCGFKYNLARTKILGLSRSPWVLGPTTLILFLMIVFMASGVVSYFAPDLSDPMLIPEPIQSEYAITWWQSPLGVASEVIRETVHAFAEVSTPRDVLEAQRMERLRNVEDTTVWGRFKRSIPYQKKRPKRVVQRRDPRAPYSPTEDGPRATIWMRLIRQFMLGLSLVGILSFLNILFTIGLFGPLQLARARWVRGGRREGLQDVGTILIIIFVTIGVARALYGIWTMTNTLAHWVLLRAENAILEVQDDEDDEVEPKANPQAAQGDAPTPVANPNAPQAEARTTARQRPLNLDDLRHRRAEGDDFGDELPDTPGGWNEIWNVEL